MTIEPSSSNSWTDMENDILRQCGDAWKKGDRVDWKNHKIALNSLFPQKSIRECKRQYHLIRHNQDTAHHCASASGGITRPLKQRLKPLALEIEQTSIFSRPLRNLSPMYLLQPPIGSQITIFSHSPFAHPPLFEAPLLPTMCLVYPSQGQDLFEVQSYDQFGKPSPSIDRHTDCSMRSTPLLENELHLDELDEKNIVFTLGSIKSPKSDNEQA